MLSPLIGSEAGLTRARRLVGRILAESSPVQAVLLYGTAGGGKAALARELAAGWLSPDPESPARRAFTRGNSPDVLTIRPGGASSIIRLGAIVPTDESEDIPLRTFFRTNPIAGDHKVAIIEEAHRMNADAANALLKPLEEPGPLARIILTTSAIGGLLPTIISRCLAVPCGLPPRDVLEAEEDQLAKLAYGSPGELAQMREKPEPYERVLRLTDTLR
ncbi:MAG: hypothetical protein C4320_09910, partial [Armatimonadota bacterium]